MSTTKPQHEIAIKFAKDSNGCVIVTFYEAHGDLRASVKAAGLPVRASGKDAIKLTGKVGQLCQSLNLRRQQFIANSHQYFSYSRPEAGTVA
jgi:hypothetical protein